MLTQNYSGFNKPKLNLKTTFFDKILLKSTEQLKMSYL